MANVLRRRIGVCFETIDEVKKYVEEVLMDSNIKKKIQEIRDELNVINKNEHKR
jgi:hypothetical protein